MIEWLRGDGKPCKANDDTGALYARIANVQIQIWRDSYGWSVQCPTLKVNRRLHTRDREQAKIGAVRELIVDARSQERLCANLAAALESSLDSTPADRV